MKISVFTPTNGRPDTLKLCKLYVERQTYPIHEHVIESGGTLAQNLRTGLPKLTGDVVVIFEDDDHYHPRWIEWCAKHLENHDVVGEAATRFYHLPTRGYAVVGTGSQRSSLCNTAFRRELLPLLLAEVRDNFIPIDLNFWGKAVEKGLRLYCNPANGLSCHAPPCQESGCADVDPERPLFVTGMKGITSGLPGMSFSHRSSYYTRFHYDDAEFTVLRSWVGNDVEFYSALR